MTDHASQDRITLSTGVLTTIARMTTLAVPGVARMAPLPLGMKRLLHRGPDETGVEVTVDGDMVYIDLYLVVASDVNVREVSRNVQHQVSRAVSEMIGMDVGHVNIHIENVEYGMDEEA